KWWNAADGKETKSLAAHESAVLGFSLSADGARLASLGADKQVKIWNAVPAKPEEGAQPLAVIPAAPPPLSLRPNGQRLVLGDGVNVRVFDTATAKEIQTLIEHTAPIKALAFLGDNRTLITASADKTAKLLDANIAAAFEAHPGGVVAA